MPDTLIADTSEWQGAVDWAAYAAASYQAGICRALYGTNHVDIQWANNLAGMRAHIRVRGYYQYLVAAQDAAVQAEAFVALVGRLQPGEFAICDVEEGAGDQQARADTWHRIVAAGCGPVDFEYSDASFAAAHLQGFASWRYVWVAAYQTNEPAVPHQLWQDTNRQTFPGIAAPCDGSIFHGSIDQLYALVTGSQAAPTPTTPEDAMQVTIGPDGTLYVAAANPAGDLLVFSRPPNTAPNAWTVMDVTAAIANANPGTKPFTVQP